MGVIGAGGVGSLVIEQLARLGVGWLLVTDPDRIDVTNLPRVVGSTRFDARTWLTDPRRPEWLRRIGRRAAARKVNIARRVARRANPDCRIEMVAGDITETAVARRFADCDYLFLAADGMQPRLVFNALVHQYLIPGVQIGAKIVPDKATGEILDVFSVSRPVSPDHGCLWCSGFLSCWPAARGRQPCRAPRAELPRRARCGRAERHHPKRHRRKPRHERFPAGLRLSLRYGSGL